MKCTVPCSLGEVIDKISILTIKLAKSTNDSQTQNIQKEYDAIICYKKANQELDLLFEKLLTVNTKLWDLEDSIRLKSKQKQFDQEYIDMAEAIHITNDERYQIKKSINVLFQSDLMEEKIYHT